MSATTGSSGSSGSSGSITRPLDPSATLATHEERSIARRRSSFRRYRPAIVPGGILLILALSAILAPLIAPYPPNALDIPHMLAGPTWAHPLGTDQLGRDQLSRVLYGGRTTMLMSLIAMIGVIALGLLVGVMAGYFGGRIDMIVSTFLTVLLSLPSLLMTLAILGILGPSTTSLLIALVGAGWVSHARIFRASILSLREQLYVDAAVSMGAGSSRIVIRHLIPNLLTTIVVLATLDFGAIILTVTSLSFLGLGVQPPTADWGTMLNDARQYFGQFPLLVLVPGICITVAALAANLLGDAIRDLVDVGYHARH